MPEDYTYQETKDFIKSIVNDDLKNNMYTTFPDIHEQQRGGFRYAPAFTQSFSGKGRGNAVLIKCYGFGNWDSKEQYFNYLVDYVIKKVNNLPGKSKPNNSSGTKK